MGPKGIMTHGQLQGEGGQTSRYPLLHATNYARDGVRGPVAGRPLEAGDAADVTAAPRFGHIERVLWPEGQSTRVVRPAGYHLNSAGLPRSRAH